MKVAEAISCREWRDIVPHSKCFGCSCKLNVLSGMELACKSPERPLTCRQLWGSTERALPEILPWTPIKGASHYYQQQVNYWVKESLGALYVLQSLLVVYKIQWKMIKYREMSLLEVGLFDNLTTIREGIDKEGSRKSNGQREHCLWDVWLLEYTQHRALLFKEPGCQ